MKKINLRILSTFILGGTLLILKETLCLMHKRMLIET